MAFHWFFKYAAEDLLDVNIDYYIVSDLDDIDDLEVSDSHDIGGMIQELPARKVVANEKAIIWKVE